MSVESSSVDLSLQCVFCKHYLVDCPRQAQCGDRLCGRCFSELQQKEKEVPCPQCGQDIVFAKCFHDKAVELEVAKATVSCSNPGCPWEGACVHYQVHTEECRFAVVACPNRTSGCTERVQRSKLDEHTASCKFSPVVCEWCGKTVIGQTQDKHLEMECDDVMVSCSNGCGEKFLRKELNHHLQSTCPLQLRPCGFSWCGCPFQGTVQLLKQHEADDVTHHLDCVSQALHQLQTDYENTKDKVLEVLSTRVQASEQQITALLSEIARMKSELAAKMKPITDAVVKAETAIQQLHEGFAELALVVQTLQATSYNGTFNWKINEVQRRRNEAKIEKVMSLYSAPFYTSRFGYKLCLRLYMDGDGSGKGTHLSFFLTVMRGEYDALLSWPFQQKVTLILLDQDKQRDIVQSFRPEPSSSSFQRPRNDMNVASGCPTFAPVSVLDNSSYVKDDVMFMKCKIELTGL